MPRRALLLATIALLAAAPAAAQDDVRTIDPGMTRAEVLERLGRPLNERRAGGYTYLFYRNDCEKSCGMNDLVVLADGKVVDAIFRSPVRRYSGTSSSPNAVRPAANPGGSGVVETVRRAGRGGIVLASPARADSTAAPASLTTPLSGPAPAPPRAQQPRPVLPVPIPGAFVNPADSVRALTPDRPTAIPGARVNPADSVRAEMVRRQQQDTTRRPN